MKKVIKLTESDLTRIVQRVIKENEYHTDEYYDFALLSYTQNLFNRT